MGGIERFSGVRTDVVPPFLFILEREDVYCLSTIQ